MKYNQLAVLPGCDYNNKKDKDYLLNFFKKNKFRRPKIVGVITTLPTKDLLGNDIPGTGGRKDLFLYINAKDERRFSGWRYVIGIMYWEDVYLNKEEEQYPIEFREKHLPQVYEETQK